MARPQRSRYCRDMSARRLATAVAVCGLLFANTAAADSPAPSIVAAGVVNAATNQAALAPYSICSIYGADLYLNGTASASANAQVPNQLGGLSVLIGITPAGLLYVSNNQINILIPNSLAPGNFALRVIRDGVSSKSVPITLQETAPGLFNGPTGFVAATHADGSALTVNSPALPGEIVVLYGTGFGRTWPDPSDRAIAPGAGPIMHGADFRFLLDGNPIDPALVQYVGLAPGYAGLYQINVRLPDSVGANPEVRVTVAGAVSAPGVRLPVALP